VLPPHHPHADHPTGSHWETGTQADSLIQQSN
jgi:hypothetical protein